MRLSIILFIILIGGVFTNSAQTIKTDEGRRLDVVNAQLTSLKVGVEREQKVLDGLLAKYTADSKEVKAQQAIVSSYKSTRSSLEEEKKALEKKPLVVTLPNTNVELLKMIVIQNEQIIELLKQINLQVQNNP